MKQSGLSKEDASYISIDSFISYAESDYLSKTIFNAEMYAWSDTLFAVGDESKRTTTRTDDSGEEVFVETLKLVSNSEPDFLADFGTLHEITSGRMFENLNEFIIGEDIAELNNISKGNVVELRGAYATDKSFSMTVVGIFLTKPI